MSSISMALAPCVSTRSAAQSRVDAGVCWSTMIFSTEETAAFDACCNRAAPCPNAERRALRKAFYLRIGCTLGFRAKSSSIRAIHVTVGVPLEFGVALFLLPGGRPLRLVGIWLIQAGGLPRRGPVLLANRSIPRIASSIRSRSWRNSDSVFARSISIPRPQFVAVHLNGLIEV